MVRNRYLSRPPLIYKTHKFRYMYLYLIENYSQHGSIFGPKPIRPFSYFQQLALLELFETQKITEHKYDLIYALRLTQSYETSTLSNNQLRQVADWRQKEGLILSEKSCPENANCNTDALYALQKMGIYDDQLPPARDYDYTLFLGGSVQDMQLRMITLLSTLFINRDQPGFNLGTIVALTCDRIIPPDEYKKYDGMTFLTIEERKGTPMVKTSDEKFEELTEATAFKGILYSLHQFCIHPDFYQSKSFTTEGYHTSRPVSFLNENSYESLLYEKNKDGYFLNENFLKMACQFIENNASPLTHITRQRLSGNEEIHRPSTKETAKKWLSQIGEFNCKNHEQCEFLAISNAPHAFYQHVAILQGLEESIPFSSKQIHQLTTAAAAASYDIPMAYALDDVTKLFYLEEKHPPE